MKFLASRLKKSGEAEGTKARRKAAKKAKKAAAAAAEANPEDAEAVKNAEENVAINGNLIEDGKCRFYAGRAEYTMPAVAKDFSDKANTIVGIVDVEGDGAEPGPGGTGHRAGHPDSSAGVLRLCPGNRLLASTQGEAGGLGAR